MGVPTWMYRDTEAGTESKIFDSGDLPKGWRDTPAAPDKKDHGANPKDAKAKK